MELRSYNDVLDMSQAGALLIRKLMDGFIARQSFVSLVLSGGTTPASLYRILAGPGFNTSIPWSRAHFFWGDERCVPPDDIESNYRLAWENLLRHIPIEHNNIHRIPAEIQPPEKACGEYEGILRSFFMDRKAAFPDAENPDFIPAFDIVLLGLGSDGHTASVFPGTELPGDESRWLCPALAPDGAPVRNRITMSLNVINNSKNVIFLVSEKSKKIILQNVLNEWGNPDSVYPASRVDPVGNLYWLLNVD